MSDSLAQNTGRDYMRLALKLARVGAGSTHPNPRVGAVAVKDGRIVGTGAHLAYGALHAETFLLQTSVHEELRGATLYVTLEPCSHHGKQPPCAEALIGAGIKAVVAAVGDPNPLVAGKGFEKLERNGISVSSGLDAVGDGAVAATRLNAPWLWSLTKKRAFITLKIATGLDGRLAAADGTSKWITGAQAREQVHQWRAMSDAICIGKGTFLADLPSLGARPEEDPCSKQRRALGGRLVNSAGPRAELCACVAAGAGGLPAWPHQPVRIVLDSQAETASYLDHYTLDRQQMTGNNRPNTRWIVACNSDAPTSALHLLESAGVTCWRFDREGGARGIALRRLAERLAADGLLDVMVEGGAGLATELIKADLVDRYRIFSAPVLPSGPRLWAGNLGHKTLDEAPRLVTEGARQYGMDVLIESLSTEAANLLNAWAAGKLSRDR